MNEKHNHSLSSINSLLEKKNHSIMIVSLFNEMITYVNQQTEKKSAKSLKRAQQESAIITTQQTSLHQTSLTWDKIADFFFSLIVRFTLRREDRDSRDNRLC